MKIKDQIFLVFNRRLICNSYYKCDGYIDCPWLTPNDEANCSSQCPSYLPIPCDCNKPGNMTCGKYGYVCNLNSGEHLSSTHCFFAVNYRLKR